MLTGSGLPRVDERLDVVVDHADLQRRRVNDDLVGGRCGGWGDLILYLFINNYLIELRAGIVGFKNSRLIHVQIFDRLSQKYCR